MRMACMKITADAANPRTIHLANGVFSDAATGEFFPINWRDYVSMKGSGIEETTIFGEDKNQLLWCYNDNGFTIDGITFQGGYGEFGGAIRLENGSSPLITNVEIKDNFAFKSGGGLYCKDYSSPQLSDVKIFNNNVNEHGGGAMFTNYCDASLKRCEVYGNFAYYSGGGLCATMYSDLQLDSISVYDNEGVAGGGIHISWGSQGTITNSAIYNNTAQSHVAGYVGQGGGAWISYYSDPVFYNVEITGNEAQNNGGGYHAESQSYAKFYNCNISNNTSVAGGAIYLYGNANHKFWNTLICSNHTPNGAGGAINSVSSSPLFTNVTITGNAATGTGQGGGALYNYNSTPQFKNCILWNNLPTEIVVYSGSVNAQYSDITGSYPGTGNINSDPLFGSVTFGDFSISEGSPCIDAGNPDTTGMLLPLFDYAGNIRIVNDIVDMGAYEYQSSSVIHLDLKVFLEGPFNGTGMNNQLTGLTDFPLSQPYNMAPWNYAGLENIAIVPANVVDWVLVELRDATSAVTATAASRVARQAAFLMNDGSIRSLDGAGNQQFDIPVIQHSLFVVVYHRNHLCIMAANPLTETGGIYAYDFTTGSGQAYNNGQKEIAPGVWGMFAGDADASGTTDMTDKTGVWNLQAGKKGYLKGDLNMNTEVDNTDKNDYCLPNIGEESQVPD